MAISSIELEDVQKILGRAIMDGDFRAKLIADPEGVLKILGYGNLSADAINFFKSLGVGTFPDAADEVEARLGGRAVVGLWI
ncbi:MAG TPA: Os1348 family NHLP clan protein [Thiobacillaceae bacterium]|nr:Os1348 family NHLP clan protein [Thiobacillaceae bacterium]